MMLHNHRAGKFHRTSNGINPSSGFRYMGSAKSGPSGQWASPYGKNKQITMTLHNYRSSQVHATLNWPIPSCNFRDVFRNVWTQFMANLASF